jgi:hypothetical protein
MISTVIIAAIILILVALCAWVIVKPPFGGSSPSARGQFVGETLLLVNKDQQRAMEHVIYQKEDKQKQDDAGDDTSRFDTDGEASSASPSSSRESD